MFVRRLIFTAILLSLPLVVKAVDLTDLNEQTDAKLDAIALEIQTNLNEGWKDLAEKIEADFASRLGLANAASVLRAADHAHRAIREAGYSQIRARRDPEFLPFIKREAVSENKTDRFWAIETLAERGDAASIEYLRIMAGHKLNWSILSRKMSGWEPDVYLRTHAAKRVSEHRALIKSCRKAFANSLFSSWRS